MSGARPYAIWPDPRSRSRSRVIESHSRGVDRQSRTVLNFIVFFCCVRFNFFSNRPRGWLGRTSLNWPVFCWLGRKTLAHSLKLLINVLLRVELLFIVSEFTAEHRWCDVSASIHFLCGSVLGLMNIYWPCDPLSAPHSYPHLAHAPQKDLFNRSFGFFKSIAYVGLMRQVKHTSYLPEVC